MGQYTLKYEWEWVTESLAQLICSKMWIHLVSKCRCSVVALFGTIFIHKIVQNRQYLQY